MKPRGLLLAVAAAALACHVPLLRGQVVDNPGFRALPRPVTYGLALTPVADPAAVIVYGRNTPWTRQGAERVQAAVREWCGKTLELVDDQTVTSDETWLLRDPYHATPLIVLGNGQDNRALHALATRSLDHSNRYWPGGDRYVIRTVFEPFVAEVNWLALCASRQAS